MKRMAAVLALVVASAGGALAEEVIYFDNGSTIPIRSHRIENGMVHVDLGDNAFMAFPQYMVERIVVAGEDVRLTPSSVKPGEGGGSLMIAGGGNGGSGRSAASAPPDRVQNNVATNDSLEVDKNTGLMMYKPFKNSAHPGKRAIGAAGHSSIRNAPVATTREQGLVGARRVGDRFVIGDVNPRRRNRPTTSLIGIERRSSSSSTRPKTGIGGDQKK